LLSTIPKDNTKQRNKTIDPAKKGRGRMNVARIPATIGPKILPILT
jgi:hypothetical protein